VEAPRFSVVKSVVKGIRALQAAEKPASAIDSYQGTTSVVPIRRLFLTRRADFSPRGIGFSDFFSSLFSPDRWPTYPFLWDMWGCCGRLWRRGWEIGSSALTWKTRNFNSIYPNSRAPSQLRGLSHQCTHFQTPCTPWFNRIRPVPLHPILLPRGYSSWLPATAYLQLGFRLPT